ncbi:MAG: asparagine--tRNA ligase [Candidatus Thermoplasmatota archaeon]|nr:asparagine--tRNA ligase [Candidatus Thermoplasmatota archaeon]MEC7142694.1 asparagine--tRNA ligase [Candidatus Thermoplasmatota archaeon]MEC7544604.1 asparagine--tRNA ligase [Candidatus Thermoplasmatota archaeon]MEC7689070.1 asparagine--tRNA ligase [Candidatus Thermoplasmatota archaeon]MEC8385054.1 asparagine--tRNA ligase [Candidatus Thermoplasmatota archaeon]|tara:strand:+ start:382 stop:1725 length:1344 start_codon:yes stop_codon:yes gene_type:complete
MKVDWIGNILSGERDHQTVELKGWVHRSRGSNKMRFVVLRDSTGTIQCVVKRDIVGDEMFEAVKSALIESSLIFKGTVLPTDREHGHEIQVQNVEIVGPVNPDRPYPITESVMDVENLSENAFLLDNRHLYLRTERMTRMLKIRSSVFGAIHQYFRNHDFIEYQAPNFVAGAVEGGSTLFEVPYFPTEENPDRKAYLTQSWQLYAEAAMPALERLYTIAPSFRAEKSRTTRHLSEFWHAEMEIAWAGNDDVMKHGEAVVRNIAQTVLDERENELTALGRDLELISRYADNSYPRIRYDEAVETLQKMGVEIEWGQDLDYSKEKILTQDFEVPHFLTHYPKVAKPFYHRVDPDDSKYVLCHDLLAPEGYGEIIGGGERTWSEDEILKRIDEEGTPRAPYQFYIDVRTYGGVPHGGFGLGVDRVCAWLAGADHIREVIPFPRDSRRVTP